MQPAIDTLTITRPDDWHLHLRIGEALHAVISDVARQFGRAIVMPNLNPPVTNVARAMAYREEIERAMEANKLPKGSFEPLMTIYLTDETTPEDIRLAKASGIVAAKLYPANATTNSAKGVTDIRKLAPVFDAMQEVGLVLCIHGETLVSKEHGDKTRDGKVGQLRREAVFLKESLSWIVETFPRLRVVLEHISTIEAVEFVQNAPARVAATITAHHLLETLDAVFESHHNKCMPILKEEEHRQALRKAATSGNPKFFIGTDLAPHSKSAKDTDCGCSGCYTGHCAIELYTTVFEEEDALDKLEGFLSHFGPDFYGLPRNTEKITLKRDPFLIPLTLPYGENEKLVPFWAGKTIPWRLVTT